ncbi:MAG TPA: hypothetical protein VK674_01300 [Candidatus Limnocylindria bacterium]|nr:hypothetical protein [Candidatus Limnocylindria bacterium]
MGWFEKGPQVLTGRARRVAAATLLGLASGCASPWGEPAPGAADDAAVVEISVTDNRFTWPDGTEFEPGQEVVAHLTNRGQVPHNALYMGGHHDHDGAVEEEPQTIKTGDTITLRFEAVAGSMIHCTFHEADMFTAVPVNE